MRWEMEQKSVGLVVGSDGVVYRSVAQTSIETKGMFPRPMAGDPPFSGAEMGSSMLNSRFNEGFRAGDLSIRTGEEFAMAFSQMGIKGGPGRSEGRSGMYQTRKIIDDGNQSYSHDGLMGVPGGTGGQMVSGSTSDVSEWSNLPAEFASDYGTAYNEPARMARFFNPGDEGECLFDDGSTRQGEFQRPWSSSAHLDHLSGGASDDVGLHKVKFMCSFGGKVLPRPSDGALRYVGGETRIVTAHRGIAFTELMQKMMQIYGQDLLLKYQLPDQDLDALVSVSCDEDLENMLDEYERLLEGSGEGSSRLRVFLFPSGDHGLAHFPAIGDRRNSEKHYVDAVNGISETGIRRVEGSIANSSSQHLENLMGFDAIDNWNSMPRDQDGMPGPSSKIIAQDVPDLRPQLPISSSLSSKQGISQFPPAPVTAPSSSSLSYAPTHFKQSGVGDTSMSLLPEQNLNISNQLYSTFQQPGGDDFHDLDYRGSTPSTTTSQHDPRRRAAGVRGEADFPTRGKMDRLQDKVDVAQPMLDRRSDGQLPPRDPRHVLLKQPTTPVHWQHYGDSYQDTYRYIQHANSDGGIAQLFQQHSLQGALPNHWPSTYEGAIMRNTDWEQQQQQDNLFGAPTPHKFVSSHLESPVVSTGAAQIGSAPKSPHLAGQQIGVGQQHLQVHHPLNAPFSEQQPYGTRVHYYDHSARPHHPPSLPPHYQGQAYELFVHQQQLPHDQLSHPKEQLIYQQKMPHDRVSRLDESCIQQRAVPHVQSDSGLQTHTMYETGPVSEGHHSDGSVPFQPMISGQHAYTNTHGGMEYMVEQQPSHFHDRLDEADWSLQHRTQEVDVPSGLRMSQSEGNEEQSAELSGGPAEPSLASSWTVLSEDIHALSSSGLSDPYQNYKQAEMFESFVPTSYQFKKAISAGDVGTMGIIPDVFQTTKLTGRKNEVAVPSSGFSVEEVRVSHPLQEQAMAHQEGNMDPPLIGINEGGSLGSSHEIIAQNENPSILTRADEQPPAQSLAENASSDGSEHLSFLLVDDLSNARSTDKIIECGFNSVAVTLPESILEQHSMQLPVKSISDDDNVHSNIQSNTSPSFEVKGGVSDSAAVTLQHSKGGSDSFSEYLKDTYAATGKVLEVSSWTESLATTNLSPTNNNTASTSLLAKGVETYQELNSTTDDLSAGLPSPTLPFSDLKVEDDSVEGEREIVIKEVAVTALRPPLCPPTMLSTHEWDQVTEDGKVHENSIPETLLKGTEEEAIDLNSEEPNTEDVDDCWPVATISTDFLSNMQTIKNADLEELRELGSGTFGTVYHGKWRGTDVAIKRIKNSCFMGKPSEQERLRADFWREAYMLAQLHHPNVVAFYGIVPDGPGGTLATVTEYMVNGSLKQVLQKKDRYRTFDHRKRLIISMDAAFGMEYLHGKNIVHFDLKCENLLVNMRDPQRPICKVGDLGLSKIKHRTLVSGGVRGTLPWMAPELLNGSSSMVSEKVDVFSFGIVMWELLTGEEPYASMHYGAIIGGIVNNTLRPPIPKGCDPSWRSLMESCWSADPSMRPTFTEITFGLRAMASMLPPKGQALQAHVQAHLQN